MKKRLLSLFIASLASAFAWAGPNDGDDLDRNESKNRKIVIFQPGISQDVKVGIITGAGAQTRKHLNSINASVALVPNDNVVNALKMNSSVLRVEDDLIAEALVVKDKEKEDADAQGKGTPPSSQPTQSSPWGIGRVKAPEANAITQGAGVSVCVVDTGIDLDHPDLKDNIKGGYNAINPAKTAEDDNGHGTHVAGTIAGINNSIGILGVAPQANLLAVKVLSRSGSGWISDIIEGIDWCVQNGGKVANMSLGSTSDSQALHDQIVVAVNAGLVIVAAAGNSGPCSNCVSYPAKYAEVLAVSASDSSDQMASFSSQGPEIDLIAPGKSVYSSYKGDSYATLSGTSMAAPHVAGCAVLKRAQNSALTPQNTMDALKSSSDPLSGLTTDQQGSGMVNCYKAVTTP